MGDRKDGDLIFAQDTSPSGQFAHQWKSRMMAQEEVATGELRRLLARNKSCECADVRIGDAGPFHEAMKRKSSPRWRGPAMILAIDETAATVKFWS